MLQVAALTAFPPLFRAPLIAWYPLWASLLLLPLAGCSARPPLESGEFREPDLVDLTQAVPGIRFDIRYASTRNFLGRPVYSEARAFLQRPAAEALARVQSAVEKDGYTLLVFDGYRPWSVTKTFWDETPSDKHQFVADPAKGSRHNRGCAVDLTLADRTTGAPVEMPSEYDEFSERAYPNYNGGVESARRRRDYLRAAMEREGFQVYEFEWWHFDFKDWQHYRVLDAPFSEIATSKGS